jgi:hypothetical protein
MQVSSNIVVLFVSLYLSLARRHNKVFRCGRAYIDQLRYDIGNIPRHNKVPPCRGAYSNLLFDNIRNKHQRHAPQGRTQRLKN